MKIQIGFLKAAEEILYLSKIFKVTNEEFS